MLFSGRCFKVGDETFWVPTSFPLALGHLTRDHSSEFNCYRVEGVNARVFRIIVKSFLLEHGLDGTEIELNLAALFAAAKLAIERGLLAVAEKIIATARKYIARRVLRLSPHNPGDRSQMTEAYFTYRSQELYRAWKILRSWSDDEARANPPIKPEHMVNLYVLCIPEGLWDDLNHRMHDDFRAALRIRSSKPRRAAPEAEFRG